MFRDLLLLLFPHCSSFPTSHVQAPYPSPVLLKILSWASGSITLAYRLGNFCPHWTVWREMYANEIMKLVVGRSTWHDLGQNYVHRSCCMRLLKGMHLIVPCLCLFFPAGNIDTASRAKQDSWHLEEKAWSIPENLISHIWYLWIMNQCFLSPTPEFLIMRENKLFSV